MIGKEIHLRFSYEGIYDLYDKIEDLQKELKSLKKQLKDNNQIQ